MIAIWNVLSPRNPHNSLDFPHLTFTYNPHNPFETLAEIKEDNIRPYYIWHVAPWQSFLSFLVVTPPPLATNQKINCFRSWFIYKNVSLTSHHQPTHPLFLLLTFSFLITAVESEQQILILFVFHTLSAFYFVFNLVRKPSGSGSWSHVKFNINYWQKITEIYSQFLLRFQTCSDITFSWFS